DDGGGGRGATDEEAAGGEAAAPDALRPAPDERTALTEQIQAVASSDFAGGGDSTPQRLADDCGLMLARELGAELIGATSTDIGQPGAVLVVVAADQPGVAQGYVLPACGAGVAEALRELTVPIE
ncbi:MAG TPA: hypothetical protein VIQ02_04335, partial [Jiangellaceae bacterium]